MGSKREFKERLGEDATFQQYRRIVSTIEKRVTVSKFVVEARSLHSSRTMRNLKGNAPSSDKVYEAIVRDMAARSRIVELKMTLFVEKELLESALSSISAHIRALYDLSDLARTLDEKKVLLKKVLNKGYTLLEEIASAVEVMDLIVKDIDQAGYAVRNLVELIKLRIERPAQVV